MPRVLDKKKKEIEGWARLPTRFHPAWVMAETMSRKMAVVVTR